MTGARGGETVLEGARTQCQSQLVGLIQEGKAHEPRSTLNTTGEFEVKIKRTTFGLSRSTYAN